jgi:anaerobic selenocysteine-containing dehydrogenase
MKRREFIILSSVGAASASLLSACGHPEEKLIPAFIPDEEYVPGIDYWKASTCGMCPAGCGIIVRTREHKANKIEGNPLHPVNRGALCARGQAGLQALYNPDRIKGPMKRVGERGEGKWQEISWEEAIKTLADKLREIKAKGDASRVAFATRCSDGVTGLAADLLASSLDPNVLLLSEVSRNTAAMSDAAGQGLPPFQVFDIANATYLFSLGARFLETWESPVRYSVAYGEFRDSRRKARGRFVHAEPRMSLTAANADEWLPSRPRSEQVLAMAVAQVITRENLIKGGPAPSLRNGSLAEYAPEKSADITGIDAERVIRIARDFASSPRPLAIGESEAVSYLNLLVGNTNKPGGLLLAAGLHFDPLKSLRAKIALPGGTGFVPSWLVASSPEAPKLSALLVHEWNPRFVYPRSDGFLEGIPFIASFSAFMDETTASADLVLPDHSFLESWDVTFAPIDDKNIAVTTSQPVTKPESNTRQTADVLIALAREIGGPGFSVPFESAEDIVRKAVGSLNPSTAETAQQEVIDRGFSIASAPNETRGPDSLSSQTLENLGSSALSDTKNPLELLTYEHLAMGAGAFANLPALQELPDPMTSVMWGSWVEINPKTAASLGIADGDLVEVSTEHGSLRVPAVLYPAIRPDVIAMPFGQGHTSFGRYATNRGANPATLNPGLQGSVRARVSKVEGKASLIRFGTDLQEHMEKKSWR